MPFKFFYHCPELHVRIFITGIITIGPDVSDIQMDDGAAQLKAFNLDPENPQASVQESGPPPQRGAGLRGAARGAAKGAVVGGTVEHFGDDDRNDATEIGAATAAVAGGVRSRRQAKKEAETQQTQAISSGSSAYTQSYNECMASRGY